MPQSPDTSFANDLAKARSGFDADLQMAREAAAQSKPVPHDVVTRLLDWLPTVGGAIGGAIGGIPGAAAGGAAGQGMKVTAQHATELPGAVRDVARNLMESPDVAKATLRGGLEGMSQGVQDAALEGGKQAAMQSAGQGLTAGARWLGPKLMQSAIKPAYAMTESAIRNAKVPRVVEAMLKNGINVTKSGVGKLQDILASKATELDDLLRASKGWVFPEAVAAQGEAVVTQAGKAAAPSADVIAAGNVVDDFMRTHGAGAGVGAFPAKPLTNLEAQEIKQATYKAVGDRAYNPGASRPGMDSEKALARGLKEGIEANVPAAKPINEEIGGLIEARKAMLKQLHMAANGNPGALAGIGSNGPGVLAYVLSRSPAVKSMIANGLYKSAEKASGVPENIIRLAVQGIVSSQEEDQQQ